MFEWFYFENPSTGCFPGGPRGHSLCSGNKKYTSEEDAIIFETLSGTYPLEAGVIRSRR